MTRFRLAAAGITALAAAGLLAGTQAQAASSWRLVWSSDFAANAPLGSFNATKGLTCPKLPAVLRSAWGAYPEGSPDTSTLRGTGLRGYYDPEQTVSVSGGMLHVRMYRGSSGPLHTAALVPLAASGRTYGKYVLTFRVLAPVTGYKTVVMLWGGAKGKEVDYPENQYTQDMFAYIHTTTPQTFFDSHVPWASGWHTTMVTWVPGRLSFYMDGRLIGTTTRNVPNYSMRWIIQSEAALNGQVAAPNSSAELDVKHAAYYAYTG